MDYGLSAVENHFYFESFMNQTSAFPLALVLHSIGKTISFVLLLELLLFLLQADFFISEYLLGLPIHDATSDYQVLNLGTNMFCLRFTWMSDGTELTTTMQNLTIHNLESYQVRVYRYFQLVWSSNLFPIIKPYEWSFYIYHVSVYSGMFF